MIEIDALTKSYGSKVAVKDLTLEIETGVFYTFLGPNGAGKTTTMKIMAGLLMPTSGSVRIDSIDVVKQPVEAKAKVGYIPDHPFLYEKLTGWEYLYFIGGLYRMSARDVKEKGGDLLEVFSLTTEASGLIDNYSHGMRQRLAFAACFLHSPKVVIIDEPWVGLDPRNIRNAIDFLKGRSQEGVTIFMSTHSLDIAEGIAEKLGIIHNGELLYNGSLEDLRAGGKNDDLEKIFLEMTEA